MIALLAALLVFRIRLSLKIADIGGDNARHMVERRGAGLFWGGVKLGIWSIPAAATNAAIRYGTSNLAMMFRKNMTKYCHEQYLRGRTYYRLNANNALTNVDQRLTADIALFTDTYARLFVSSFKPVLDIGTFSYAIAKNGGIAGPASMAAYFFCSAVFLRSIMPPFAKLTSKSQHLEGVLRQGHTRVIGSAEEIAFIDGGARERVILDGKFGDVVNHARMLFGLQMRQGVFDEYLTKYGATLVGYSVVARPIWEKNSKLKTGADITSHYVRTHHKLMALAKGLGQLLMLYKNVTALAGYTARVSELVEKLHEINGVGSSKSGSGDPRKVPSPAITMPTGTAVGSDGVVVSKGNAIIFEDVDICNPDGAYLARHLSFRMESGQNLLISGPNGCGKSSMFRVLGELWPFPRGTITKPASSDIFYVPQKAYLATGSLRDQVTYPDTTEQARKKGFTDDRLYEIMTWVNLEAIVARSGGWDAQNDWDDVLSGGERQRISMARLFYHSPSFAILDECTSQTSMDVEGAMYTKAKELGITLITVSHRKSLWQYHEFHLQFTPDSSDGKTHKLTLLTDEEKSYHAV